MISYSITNIYDINMTIKQNSRFMISLLCKYVIWHCVLYKAN